MDDQQLIKIWTKRQKLLKNKTWNGSAPKCGFDFTKGIHDQLIYENENWRDLTINDLRTILNNLLYEDKVPDGFDYNEIGTKYSILKIMSNDQLTITTSMNFMQPQFTILHDESAYSISWYKRRGKIDSFIDLEYGTPIDIEALTYILIALNLEKDSE